MHTRFVKVDFHLSVCRREHERERPRKHNKANREVFDWLLKSNNKANQEVFDCLLKNNKHKAFMEKFNLAKYFVGKNFRQTKLFVGYNFRHLKKKICHFCQTFLVRESMTF